MTPRSLVPKYLVGTSIGVSSGLEYSFDCMYEQRCWKHLESGEATLLSEAGRRCGCQTQGLYM